nr:hypothetical protein [uncultured Mediterranean phage uvMED]
MLMNSYDDFILCNLDVLRKDNSRLLDLNDEQLDKAVYIWLTTHKTWLDDIYPANFMNGMDDVCTELLFGRVQASSAVISQIFKAMEKDCGNPDQRDDNWFCTALNKHIDYMVEWDNFKDDFKDEIYRYLERNIEEHLFDRMYMLLEDWGCER